MQDIAGWTLHLYPAWLSSTKITNCHVGTGTSAAKGPILCELLDERLMSCSKMDVSEWMRINPASTATYATSCTTSYPKLPNKGHCRGVCPKERDCHYRNLPHLLGADMMIHAEYLNTWISNRIIGVSEMVDLKDSNSFKPLQRVTSNHPAGRSAETCPASARLRRSFGRFDSGRKTERVCLAMKQSFGALGRFVFNASFLPS